MSKKYDETKVQEICGRLVRNEVLACVTWLVDELMENNPDLLYDDGRVVNMSRRTCPECGESIEGVDVGYDDNGNEIMGWPSWADESADEQEWLDDHYQCPNCDHVFHEDNAGEGWAEVYEWWIVSSWLAEKLEARGHVLFDDEVWGREATGQAILLDGVIRDICRELGWLDDAEIGDESN